jgi:hypothetical protein
MEVVSMTKQWSSRGRGGHDRFETLYVMGVVALAICFAIGASGAELPPRNPYLADSVYPLGHGDSGQQDALPVPGPTDPGPELAPDEIQYSHVGPGHFGAYTSSPYPDGRRVIWSNGLDRIVKSDFETLEVLATYWVPEARRWSEEEANAAIETFDASNEGFFSIWRAFREALKLRDLSSVYTVLDADNTYYVADKSGAITAYGDARRDRANGRHEYDLRRLADRTDRARLSRRDLTGFRSTSRDPPPAFGGRRGEGDQADWLRLGAQRGRRRR